jgi:uncharacterized protein YecE (DUF72 family)
MTADVRIGTVGFTAPQPQVLKRLQCVEFVESFQGHPGTAGLKRLRSRAAKHFTFVVQGSCALTHAAADPVRQKARLPYLPEGAAEDGLHDSESVRAAWDFTEGVAQALNASTVYLQTPQAFRPTRANRQRLSRFAERITAPGDRQIVWDGQGLWSQQESLSICRDLAWIPCLDPLVDDVPPLQACYLRVLGRARSPHGLSADALYLIAAAAERIEHGLVVFHTPTAYRDALSLVRRLQSG